MVTLDFLRATVAHTVSVFLAASRPLLVKLDLDVQVDAFTYMYMVQNEHRCQRGANERPLHILWKWPIINTLYW